MLAETNTTPAPKHKTKVAFLLPNLLAGGAERVTLNLLKGNLRELFDLSFWVIRKEGPLFDQIPSNLPLTVLDAHNTLSAITRLARAIRTQQPEILVSMITPANVVATLAAKLAKARTRMVLVEHGSILTHKEGRTGLERILPFLQKYVYRLADKIVSVSEGLAEEISLNTGLNASKIQVVYNPVLSRDFYTRAEETVTHPWLSAKDSFCVVMAGRLQDVKDPILAIKAIAALKRRMDCKFLLLGDGALRTEVEENIRRLQLENCAEVVGYVSNPLPYIKHADCLLMTSYSEALPTAIVEARALGLPVVATDCPWGPREILNKLGHGILVAERDPEKLADALQKAEGLSKRVPEKALLAPFTLEASVEQYATIIRSLT